VRALDLPYMDELFQRVVSCCEAAAQATGCKVKVSSTSKDYQPFRPARGLAELFQRNLVSLGEPVDQGVVDQDIGSSEVGNVSQVVPTIQPMLQIAPRNITNHMAEFAESAISDRGHQAMGLAAKAMAMTAVDLALDPTALAQVDAEFRADRAASPPTS
jgi:metal-dependent amidase/aminoacylase/carboxypeptidase family protein